MKYQLGKLFHRGLLAITYSAIGAVVVLLIVFVVYLNNQADLQVWHLVELDQEFTVHSKVDNFEDYLELENRLFQQLERQINNKIPDEQRSSINRYNPGSLTDPERWSQNWNRSFVLPQATPRASVLLLHGMSDSPYSLRHLGERLNAAGAYVLGLRLPGHGTAPSGLVEISWQDMTAAVKLAMRHLAKKNGGQTIYIIGYSNGAALAVHYALSSLKDETLPQVKRVVLLSPAIGVNPIAALAVWQARLGHLLGLDKLAWNSVLPEYDSYKYGSFAVNAGNVVYQLTEEIQENLSTLEKENKLNNLPPILAFSSIVDATVSTPALISGLFERIPAGGHELVLFDINHQAEIKPLFKWDPANIIQALKVNPDHSFTLGIISNELTQSRDVFEYSRHPGENDWTSSMLKLHWPEDLYSLSHVSLPFSADDPLYGSNHLNKNPGIQLGNIALRGERGVLQISGSDMMRLRWNPFFPYVETKVFNFLGLEERP